jgi:cytochrome c553
MRLAVVVVLGGGLLAQGVCAEVVGDREAGRQIAGQCRTCHGLDGVAKIPIAPNIGGENPAYIIHQLTAFRDGTRVHEMMSVVAKGLTDAQIADLAAWYSGHAASAELPPGRDAATAPADCVACHGAAGIAEVPDAPNLAGETAMYIDTQLKAFRQGKRQHEIMSGIAAGLDDAQIRALADWYGATRLRVELAP